MIEFQGLRTCIYQVPDLEKAKIWYSTTFAVTPYFDEPFYVGFNVAGYELGLIPLEKENVPLGENIQIYWGVADVQAAYSYLLTQGAVAFEDPHDVGGDIMTALVKDPWANVLGIIYNPHFKLT